MRISRYRLLELLVTGKLYEYLQYEINFQLIFLQPDIKSWTRIYEVIATKQQSL
jgi:hypothetical protein